jgi:hypothetical protein
MERELLNIGRDQGWRIFQGSGTKLPIKIKFSDFLAQRSDQLATNGVFDLWAVKGAVPVSSNCLTCAEEIECFLASVVISTPAANRNLFNWSACSGSQLSLLMIG